MADPSVLKSDNKLQNGLCVDVEDYTDLEDVLPLRKNLPPEVSKGVLSSTIRILDILDRTNTKGTFFLIASLIEKIPDIAIEIERRGHEIGLHGYDHQVLYPMSRDDFSRAIEKALAVLKKYISQEIIGYQAPRFSINKDSLWALEVLIEKGFRYDCSIFPIKHPDYGIEGFSRYPVRIREEFYEIPMPTLRILGKNLPFGGGGYLRHYPYFATRFFLRCYNRSGHPALVYVHPWEFDDPRNWMDIFEIDKVGRFRKWRFLESCGKTLTSKFEYLMQDFLFVPVRQIYESLKK